MADFPLLRTGALTQFPLTRSLRMPVQSVTFVDGSRQTYRLRAAPMRRWFVRLDQLDAEELNAVIDFAELQGTDEFAFTDPLTGSDVARCVIGDPGLESGMQSELWGQTILTIEELP